jgi:hypothetical protein
MAPSLNHPSVAPVKPQTATTPPLTAAMTSEAQSVRTPAGAAPPQQASVTDTAGLVGGARSDRQIFGVRQVTATHREGNDEPDHAVHGSRLADGALAGEGTERHQSFARASMRCREEA